MDETKEPVNSTNALNELYKAKESIQQAINALEKEKYNPNDMKLSEIISICENK
jgi:hypothetical protein